MSITEIRQQWEIALQAAERAVSTASSIAAVSASEAAGLRGGLSQQREALRRLLG